MAKQMKSQINDLFNLSSYRNMKVFHRFKKIVLESSTNDKDIDMIKLYLFQVAESSIYDYDPIDFISEIDCFEFVEKYANQLSDINTLNLNGNNIDITDCNYYELCKTCYVEFCKDILKQIN